MDPSSDYDLTRICRSCRKEDRQSLVIFDSVGSNGVPLEEMIASCIQNQINKNDGMPSRLCRICVSDVTAAYEFRKRYEESDSILREYISRRKFEPIDERDDVEGGMAVETIDIKQEFYFGELDLLQEQNEQQPDDGEYMEADVDPAGFHDFSDRDSSISGDEDSKPKFDVPISEEGKAEMEKLLGVPLDTDASVSCPVCWKEFSKKSHLTRHMRCHLSRQKFICELCNTGFTRRDHLYRHMKTHDPAEKKLECPKCHKKFVRRDHIRAHLKKYTLTPLEIEEVMQSFPVETPENESKGLKECHVCGKKFFRAFRLKQHLLSHEADIQCDHCDKKFAAVAYQEYKGHMELDHPGWELLPERKVEYQESYRPFRCNLCVRAFNRKTHLNRHMAMHDSSKQFECNVCRKMFNRKDNLQKHLKMHVKDGVLMESQLQQIIEEKERQMQLSTQNRDNGEDDDDDVGDSKADIFKKPELAELMKQKQCPFCSRTFGRFYHLKRHMKLHGVGVETGGKQKGEGGFGG